MCGILASPCPWQHLLFLCINFSLSLSLSVPVYVLVYDSSSLSGCKWYLIIAMKKQIVCIYLLCMYVCMHACMHACMYKHMYACRAVCLPHYTCRHQRTTWRSSFTPSTTSVPHLLPSWTWDSGCQAVSLGNKLAYPLNQSHQLGHEHLTLHSHTHQHTN